MFIHPFIYLQLLLLHINIIIIFWCCSIHICMATKNKYLLFKDYLAKMANSKTKKVYKKGKKKNK